MVTGTRAAALSLAGLLWAIAPPAHAVDLPAPAVWGDFSLGVGPALVLLPRGPASALTGEINLLAGAFTFGARGRVADRAGELQPAVGLEASVLGMIGAGASWQAAGPSIDGLLQIPVPLLPAPFYLALSWRPSVLLRGGVEHEVALQLKWSSLLLPDDE